MTRLNNELKVKSFEYGVCGKGRLIGQPAVTLVLGESKKKKTVKSLKRQFDNYGWLSKIRSGLPVYIRCEDDKRSDPLNGKYASTIKDIVDVFKPARLAIETIAPQKYDSDTLKLADYAILNITAKDAESRIKDDDEWTHQFLKDTLHVNADYVLGIDSSKDRYRVQDFSKHFSVRDAFIWLFPMGDTPKEIGHTYKHSVSMAKTNVWNVLPRYDLMEYKEEKPAE